MTDTLLNCPLHGMATFTPTDIDRQLIELALREDFGGQYIDLTSIALFSTDNQRDIFKCPLSNCSTSQSAIQNDSFEGANLNPGKQGNNKGLKSNVDQVKIISKESESIVISGLGLIPEIFAIFADNYQKLHGLDLGEFKIISSVSDGSVVNPGETVIVIEANATALMMLERTILNFVRHLSAIATLTRKFVNCAANVALNSEPAPDCANDMIIGDSEAECAGDDRFHTAKILDTRKTTPGMRHLEKYAVLCGGGVNHRMGLYDAIMVKDNHVDVLGGMQKAMALISPRAQRTKSSRQTQAIKQKHDASDNSDMIFANTNKEGLVEEGQKAVQLDACDVIVEVRNIVELQAVLDYGQGKVTRVLLDNMSNDELRKCVELNDGVFETEASGNMILDRIAGVAATGVDFISVGCLTHSAGQVDLSMRAIK